MNNIPLHSRRSFLKALGLGSTALFLSGIETCSTRQKKRPNIVLIMSDDMGFSDIGCFGSEIETPNLDALAAGGLRFTQFYNTARCCPTRASLLTGLYPHQTGVGHMMVNRELKGYEGDLNHNCLTIAEVLKQAGYATCMTGKWHVTPFYKENTPMHNWPLRRGFERFFGTLLGAGSFFDPGSLMRDNTPVPPDEDFYYTDAISNNAAQYIREHDGSRPLFLYMAFTAAHWPMHARPEDMAKYKGRYDKGWDALRLERHERLKKMGLVDPNWPLTSRDPEVPAWEDEEMKDWQCRRMEVYAAMIHSMDRGIGRVVSALKEKGMFENTLIFFLQDNGGCAEERGSRGPVTPDQYSKIPLKPMSPGEIQRDMQPLTTRDGRPVRTGEGVMPGSPDTFIAYGKGWANASNTPFRLYKHWVHEGGISTPLIVHWPDGFPSKGELRHTPGHLIDIMATCVDVASAEYPETFNGNRIIPYEGKSLIPAFFNRPVKREAIFWEHEGNRAIRRGRWKLVSTPEKLMQFTEADENAWELYDLESDRT